MVEAGLWVVAPGGHSVVEYLGFNPPRPRYVRQVATKTGRDEEYVRAVLRTHRRRFTKLANGHLTLSEGALR
jgi:hypothetical protein